MTVTWGTGHPTHWRRISRLLMIVAIAWLMSLPSLAASEEDGAFNEEGLEMGLPLSLTGSLSAGAHEGTFTMGPLDETPVELALRLHAPHADMKLVNLTEKSLTGTTEGDRVFTPQDPSPSVENHVFEQLEIHLDEAGKGFYLLVYADHAPARFTMEPLSREAYLESQPEGRELSYSDNPGSNHPKRTVSEDMLGFVGGDPYTLITGDFTVVLFETDLAVKHADGTQHFETGESREGMASSTLPGDLPVDLPVDPMVNKYSQYARFDLQDARLAMRAVGPQAELITPFEAMKIDVNGSVESPSLLGSIQMNDQLVNMKGDSARMEGEFTMQPTGKKGDNKALFSFQGDVETLTVGPETYQKQSTVTQAAGVAILLAGVTAAVWQVAKSGLLVPLYAKLTRRKVLDQATRQHVHDKIREDPGCTTRTVADALRISWSTAAYHLRVLRHMGLVTTKRQGRHEHFFVTGESTQSQQLVQAALQNPTTRRIAHLIAENPGIIQKDVCDRLGIAASTASDHLKRLRETGAVREERQWRTRSYYPAQLLSGDVHDGRYPPYSLQVATTAATTSA